MVADALEVAGVVDALGKFPLAGDVPMAVEGVTTGALRADEGEEAEAAVVFFGGTRDGAAFGVEDVWGAVAPFLTVLAEFIGLGVLRRAGV